MAEAVRCDVCGEFTLPECAEKITMSELTRQEVEGTGNYSPTHRVVVHPPKEIDCCSACLDDLALLISRLGDKSKPRHLRLH